MVLVGRSRPWLLSRSVLKPWSHRLLVVALLVASALALAFLVLHRLGTGGVSTQAESVLADEPEVPFGLTLEGPATARLSRSDEGELEGYPVVLTAQVSLPSALWPATERLVLVMVAADGERRENHFRALDQPLGISISPQFEPPSLLPPLTPEMVARSPADSSVVSTFRANVALLAFPLGKRVYRAHAALDGLRSNELQLELTVDE